MADEEIKATFDLYNINRAKLENVFHRVCGSARLDIEIRDRFGRPIVPREWFLVPLLIIDESVRRTERSPHTLMIRRLNSLHGSRHPFDQRVFIYGTPNSATVPQPVLFEMPQLITSITVCG